MNDWVMDHLLLVSLGGAALLLLLILLVMAFQALSLRNAIARERELRRLQEQSLAEQQLRHQSELEQWRADQSRQLELLREENRARLDDLRQDYARQVQAQKEQFALQLEETRGSVKREAEAELKEWKLKEEKAIRKDAVDKSRATIAGKVSEQLVPYLPGFGYNPKDARFLGSPIDLVVFDGLDEGELRKVFMIEIKTGVSQLTTRERQLRDVVTEGKVEWRELRLDS